MRGFPPVQIVLLVLGFLAAAWPLARLTGNAISPGPAPPPPAPENALVPAEISLRTAHPPDRLRVSQGDRVLLDAGVSSSRVIEVRASINTGPAAPDFLIEGEWPTSVPETAVTLEVRPDGLEAHRDTRWSVDGKLDAIVPLAWP